VLPAAEPVQATAPVGEEPVTEEPEIADAVVEEPEIAEPVVEDPVVEEPVVEDPVVSGIPVFEPRRAQSPRFEAPAESDAPADDSAVADSADDASAALPDAGDAESAQTPVDQSSAPQPERPMVGASFGIGIKRKAPDAPLPTAFDEILETGSAGSHKTASTLIFTPSPEAGSLSGPVAATGELLITGTYALPEGMGSQGHALGTTDGKDVDAVLLDSELAPASSPTPIAASSAIATSKPAGEVIRPPAPDKGGRLTLTLAIVAGGLALALAASLIIAFVTGVLG